MRTAVGGLKGAALAVLLATGLAACESGEEDVAMMDQSASDIAEARAAAERAAAAAEEAAAAAQRAEAAAAAAQRSAEGASRMFQQSTRK
jgi:hypothetical protein